MIVKTTGNRRPVAIVTERPGVGDGPHRLGDSGGGRIGMIARTGGD